jgi:hypothetical protein
MARGSFPRGFSVSITAMKGGKTRVIMWRRATLQGGERKKLLDLVVEDGQAIALHPPVVGGKGNRRKVSLTIGADHVAEGVE